MGKIYVLTLILYETYIRMKGQALFCFVIITNEPTDEFRYSINDMYAAIVTGTLRFSHAYQSPSLHMPMGKVLEGKI